VDGTSTPRIKLPDGFTIDLGGPGPANTADHLPHGLQRLVGLEDRPERCAELCVMEVFGDTVDATPSAAVGMGTHPFRDPRMVEDFAAPRVDLDVGEFHTYAVEWRPDRAVFLVDGEPVRTVGVTPDHPMQTMLAVLPARHRSDRSAVSAATSPLGRRAAPRTAVRRPRHERPTGASARGPAAVATPARPGCPGQARVHGDEGRRPVEPADRLDAQPRAVSSLDPGRGRIRILGRDATMDLPANPPAPSGHTPDGGVLVGSDGARRRLVVFEDPQCPYCRQFEEVSGDLLRREVAAGAVGVEYRMRCFLGPESVRADNALALAAETGRFDQLRRELFATQPPEHSGGFTAEDLLELGRRVGLDDPGYGIGVREERYAAWVVAVDRVFQEQDPQGTPAALLDGEPVDSSALYDDRALGDLLRR
jgi:hypothetical protein